MPVTNHLFSHSEFVITTQEHLIILGVVWKNLAIWSIVAWSPPLIQWLKKIQLLLEIFWAVIENFSCQLGQRKTFGEKF
jgi:hypothetical protein